MSIRLIKFAFSSLVLGLALCYGLFLAFQSPKGFEPKKIFNELNKAQSAIEAFEKMNSEEQK